MKLNIQVCLTTGTFFCSLLLASPSQAQVVPDGTLPNNSTLTIDGSTNIITGGTQASNNLFHSFDSFSVTTGGTAYFNNAPEIQNIFSRVTGSSTSNIDGLIRANGTSNLFLINPNGIIFGNNAKLDIGGSFVGSTASNIYFSDGFQFTATSSQNTPLLTVSVPIGLGFSSKPGSIKVIGKGHDVIAVNYQPLDRGNNSEAGLKVRPGKTLALVGGDVNLEGGILTAEEGRVELGSVEQGLVKLNQSISGLSLEYEQASVFKDINLSQKSLIDVSGFGSGSIQVEGRRLHLSDASLLLNQNQGMLQSRTIKVSASDSIQIDGFEPYSFDPNRGLVSGIWSETLGFGDGGEISVTTPKLTFQSSGQIFSATSGAAKAGDINLFVSNSLQLLGFFPNEIQGGTSISSLSLGSGRSGNIKILTGRLNVTNGSYILTSNVTPFVTGIVSGGSGDINIDATNSVEVSGTSPDFLNLPSSISAATFSTGQAGNVNINTSILKVNSGGTIDSSTGAYGSAGSVTVNALNLVEVTGVGSSSQSPSSIISSARTLDEDLQQLLRLPPAPMGSSGSVEINTAQLNIDSKGLVSVRSDGLGNSGTLKINANSINLSNGGNITAASASGEGGDISLRSQNLQLRNGSNLTATAGGSGNGGNINIDTNLLTLTQASRITADAIAGNGGNININTVGLFRSPDSPITASSQLGIDGTVQINTLINLPFDPTIQLPQNPVDPTRLIAQVCPGNVGGGSSFVITGRGGKPEDPFVDPPSPEEQPWIDDRPIVSNQNLQTKPANSSNVPQSKVENWVDKEPVPLIAADNWRYNSQGEIVLYASNQSVPSLPTLECQALK